MVGNGVGGQQPRVMSGMQSISTIVVPVSGAGWLQRMCADASQDLEYGRGVVHIIDKFPTLPPSALEILSPLGLTATEGALGKAMKLESQLPKNNVTFLFPVMQHSKLLDLRSRICPRRNRAVSWAVTSSRRSSIIYLHLATYLRQLSSWRTYISSPSTTISF